MRDVSDRMPDERKPYRQVRAVATPVIDPGYTFGTVTDKISSIVLEAQDAAGWFVGFAISFAPGQHAVRDAQRIWCSSGIGIWGVNVPVAWGFDIINFVWWIGIGHAGTLISAILLLLRADAGARRSTASPKR